LTFLCTPMVYATKVCCFFFINKLHNWWYTKKPKLIAVTYKTHGVKTINKDLRGNTAADRKQLTDYKTYSPTWKPAKYSSNNFCFSVHGSIDVSLGHSLLISAIPFELHFVEAESSSAVQQHNTLHKFSNIHLYVLKFACTY